MSPSPACFGLHALDQRAATGSAVRSMATNMTITRAGMTSWRYYVGQGVVFLGRIREKLGVEFNN